MHSIHYYIGRGVVNFLLPMHNFIFMQNPYKLTWSPGMKFRPCIDLHNGVVKQIVGSSLSENVEVAPIENFVAKKPAADFARFDRV